MTKQANIARATPRTRHATLLLVGAALLIAPLALLWWLYGVWPPLPGLAFAAVVSAVSEGAFLARGQFAWLPVLARYAGHLVAILSCARALAALPAATPGWLAVISVLFLAAACYVWLGACRHDILLLWQLRRMRRSRRG
jgi:hypothetical protein